MVIRTDKTSPPPQKRIREKRPVEPDPKAAEKVDPQPVKQLDPRAPAPTVDPAAEAKGGGAAGVQQARRVQATPQAIQAEQARSETVDRDVRQGLQASVSTASDAERSETRNFAQEQITASHKGGKVAKNELTPEYKAAQDLVRAFAPDLAASLGVKLDAKVAEKAPGLHAAKQATQPHVQKMVDDILASPAAMASLSGLVSAVGKDGVGAALRTSGPQVAEQLAQATGTSLMNPEATRAFFTSFPGAVAKVMPGKAEAATALSAKAMTKLGLHGAQAAHAAEGAAAVAATASHVAQGAEVAAAGAQVAGAGAKATAQSVPGLNVVVGAATTTMATVGLVKSLFHKPRSAARIAAEAGNTLIQAVGIMFPIVGGIGTVAKLGVDKMLDHRDQQAGRAPPELSAGFERAKASVPALLTGLEALEHAFAGADDPATAGKLQGLRASANALRAHAEKIDAHQGPLPGEDVAEFRKRVEAFMGDVTQTAHAELTDAAQGEKGAQQTALLAAADGFGKLFATLKKHQVLEKQKRMPGAEPNPDDEKTKRAELRGDVVGVAKDALVSVAAALAASKGAKADGAAA